MIGVVVEDGMVFNQVEYNLEDVGGYADHVVESVEVMWGLCIVPSYM